MHEQHDHHWRDNSAWQQLDTVSFSITGMPEALWSERSRRARVYGMSLDQYVVAILGHLAWRTPFAEDLEPFDSWPDFRRSRAHERWRRPADLGKRG